MFSGFCGGFEHSYQIRPIQMKTEASAHLAVLLKFLVNGLPIIVTIGSVVFNCMGSAALAMVPPQRPWGKQSTLSAASTRMHRSVSESTGKGGV